MGPYMLEPLHGATRGELGLRSALALDALSPKTPESPFFSFQVPSLHGCLSLPRGSSSPHRVPSALRGGAWLSPRASLVGLGLGLGWSLPVALRLCSAG